MKKREIPYVAPNERAKLHEGRYEKTKHNNMKNGIPDKKYYFLLDWKDKNMEEYIALIGERRMCDLTTNELNELHKSITNK